MAENLDLKALLKSKKEELAKIREDIAKLEQQAQQLAQQIQKQKDSLLTRGIEVQGAIKLMEKELGVKDDEPKAEKTEEVKKDEKVNLEEAK